jgi:hypothetical protein
MGSGHREHGAEPQGVWAAAAVLAGQGEGGVGCSLRRPRSLEGGKLSRQWNYAAMKGYPKTT